MAKAAKNRIKKHFITLLRFFIGFLIALAIVSLMTKLSILIGNDFVIKLNPEEKSFYIHYPETANASFIISSINAQFCNAYCNYSFQDISSGKELDSGIFILNEKIQKSYLLSGRLGSGQNIYSFSVTCSNEKKLPCFSEGIPSTRTALITLNYEPSEYEKALKDQLKDNLTKFMKELSIMDMELQRLNLQIYALGSSMNTLELSGHLNNLNSDFSQIHLEAENLRAVWHGENYTELASLFSESYWENIEELKSKITNFKENLNSTIILHNSLLNRAMRLSRENYSEAEKIAYLSNDEMLNESINAFIKNLNSNLQSIQEKSYSNYSELSANIEGLELRQNMISEKAVEDAVPKYLYSNYVVFSEQDYLCMSKDICAAHPALASLNTSSLTVGNSGSSIKAECEKIQNITETENGIFPESSPYENSSEFKKLINITSQNLRINISNKYAEENIINLSTKELLTINITNESLKNLTVLEIMAPVKPIISEMTLEFNKTYCKDLNISIEIFGLSNLSNASIPEVNVNTTQVNTNISDNPPICCFFGECKQCCTECASPELYPIIFLHGHALDQRNSPEYSLDTFNKIQIKMQEDGYINAGVVSINSNLDETGYGEWSRAGVPITVKASYYYDAYFNSSEYILYPQKSENIDTYAIRLRDIIDVVRFRTGQEKVILIGHSMGGLVARRYPEIFGEDNVDKIITIATPNSGIQPEIVNFCNVFGAEKECTDMETNSIFMKKLNDPLLAPKKIKVYAIAGSGCPMSNQTGDGVVLYKNAILPFATNYNLNGTCAGLSLLHAEIQDIDKYPQTYEYIRETFRS